MYRKRNEGRDRGPVRRPQQGNSYRGQAPTWGNRQESWAGRPPWRGQGQPRPVQSRQLEAMEQAGGPTTLRVIGGACKGRVLRCPVGLGVRPTTERVRESVFDLIGKRIERAVFYDAFAGTGAMGIEALSRGARWALFVESSRRVELVLRSNIAGCGYAGSSESLTGSFLDFCRSGRKTRNFDEPDIIYLDPPYMLEDHTELLEAVAATGWPEAKPELLVVFERPSRRSEMTAEQLPAALEIKDSRRYGDTSLLLLGPKK